MYMQDTRLSRALLKAKKQHVDFSLLLFFFLQVRENSRIFARKSISFHFIYILYTLKRQNAIFSPRARRV